MPRQSPFPRDNRPSEKTEPQASAEQRQNPSPPPNEVAGGCEKFRPGRGRRNSPRGRGHLSKAPSVHAYTANPGRADEARGGRNAMTYEAKAPEFLSVREAAELLKSLKERLRIGAAADDCLSRRWTADVSGFGALTPWRSWSPPPCRSGPGSTRATLIRMSYRPRLCGPSARAHLPMRTARRTECLRASSVSPETGSSRVAARIPPVELCLPCLGGDATCVTTSAPAVSRIHSAIWSARSPNALRSLASDFPQSPPSLPISSP